MQEIRVVFYAREFGDKWEYPFDDAAIEPFFAQLNMELNGCGIKFSFAHEPNVCLKINGYQDMLNSVRICAPEHGFPSLCLGQFLGASTDADFLADVKRGVRRVAFSPESIAPVGGDALCHNCGCGC
ncbi:MAG: hypothetical protein ACP5FP_04215 [Desulfuromonadaceae bacterium]